MNNVTHLQYWTLNVQIPVISINIDFDIRKDLLVGVLLVLAGLAIPFLAVLKIIEMGFGLAFLGFGLAFAGGISLLVNVGEIG